MTDPPDPPEPSVHEVVVEVPVVEPSVVAPSVHEVVVEVPVVVPSVVVVSSSVSEYLQLLLLSILRLPSVLMS